MNKSKRTKSKNSFRSFWNYSSYVNDKAAKYVTREAPKIINSSKTTIICGFVFFFCLLFFILSYYINPENWSWSNLFLNIAVALFQLLLGIIIVNIFMSFFDKRRMSTAGLLAVNGGIIVFHKHITELMINKYGRNDFINFLNDIKSNDFNPDYMSEEMIAKFIAAIEGDYSRLMEEAYACSGRISQTADTGAFSGNPECLSYSLMIKKLIGILSEINIKDPSHHKFFIRYLMNFYYLLYLIRDNLLKQAGIRDDEEWYF